FAALFALLWATEAKDRRMLGWALASTTSALAILAALHALIAVSPGWSYLQATSHIGGSTLARGLVLERPVRATFGTWGILLAAAGPGRLRPVRGHGGDRGALAAGVLDPARCPPPRRRMIPGTDPQPWASAATSVRRKQPTMWSLTSPPACMKA